MCNNDASTREASPAPSSALSSCDIVSVTTGHDVGAVPSAATQGSALPSSTGQPPLKKRKLTFAEKEAKAAEKVQREAEKAAEKARKEAEKAEKKVRQDEDKARKDDEKRLKDEEKRRKAEEIEAKKRARELKEEEEAQKKLKKERSQMRLGAFFQKPATSVENDAASHDEGTTRSTARRKSLSLEPFDAVADRIRKSESPCKATAVARSALPASPAPTAAKPTVSDYKKYFLPFPLQMHTYLADERCPDQLGERQSAFDRNLERSSLHEGLGSILLDAPTSLDLHFQSERSFARGLPLSSMRQLAEQTRGSMQLPVDFTKDETPPNPIDALNMISRRYLEFSEDVRPAYSGTYTKIRSPRSFRRLSRNPFSRSRPDTDYDYDSEAEWEDPGEGEDLVDEEDDEAESLGDANDNIDDFLDDEEDALKTRRKLIADDLAPTSTGLCWEDETGRFSDSTENGSPVRALRDMRIGFLLPGFTGTTIDPFSTAYWESDSPAVSAPTAKPEQLEASTETLMLPPRPPLQPRFNSNGTLDHLITGSLGMNMNTTIATSITPSARQPGRKPLPKTLSKEDMDEFGDFVVGTRATKADLLKELKTR